MILSVRQAIELEIPPHFTHNTGSKWGQTHEMPFGVIAGAIASIGSAIGASVAGGIAAGAAIAAGGAITVAGVTAIVGAVATVATIAGLGLTVIGLATGNKTLTKIGGYIGIAGGIAGIAAGAVNLAVGAGAQAAGAGAGAAAAGAAGTSTASGAAATGAAQAAVVAPTHGIAETAKQAVVQASTQVADKGSWFGNLFDDIGSGIASNYDKTFTALGSAGTDSLAVAAKTTTTTTPLAAPTTATVAPPIAQAAGGAAKSSSFFGNLFGGDNLKNVLEIGKVGAGMIGGSAKQDMENQQLNTIMAHKYADLGQNQYQFNKNFAYKEQQDAIQRANKNSIANLDFETRQATPEEKDAYEKEKAQKSRAMAEALVTPAPLAPGAR
jgi:hypothetical protein